MPALFHILFKALAILVYMFGEWFSSSFVNIFVACVLLLAFDFWTVKNVSGRLMVGLRWWSEVMDDGSTVWKFESQEVSAALASSSAVPRAVKASQPLLPRSRGRAGKPAEHLAGCRRLLGRPARARCHMGAARRQHVPQAEVRLAAAGVHGAGALGRQRRWIRPVQVGRQGEILGHGGQSAGWWLRGQGPAKCRRLGVRLLRTTESKH